MNEVQPLGFSDDSYVSQFRSHLAEFQAHLAGLVDVHCSPSYVPPTGYWTPSEKNAFFHSLSIYSRFRPDLIAASIGTKNVIDVCSYIDLLDKNLAQHGRLLRKRSDLPCAYEVSNSWIVREENMAEELLPLETGWEKEFQRLQREKEISERKIFQSEAAGSGDGTAVETLESWEHDRRGHWSQEDALSSLECHHLKVIERILRDAEHSDADVEDDQPEDQEAAPGDIPPSGASPPDRDAQSLVDSDGVIDPLLLKASNKVVLDQSSMHGCQPCSHVSPHSETPHDAHSVSKTAPHPPASSVAQPLDSPRSPNPDNDKDTSFNQSDLSPASRRRIQKRLHMRRKRAAQRGEDVIADSGKLRPGRKRKEGKDTVSIGKQLPEQSQGGDEEEEALIEGQRGADGALPTYCTPSGEVSGVDEEENDGDASRRNKSGTTKPYKIKSDFQSRGIDFNTLVDGNLGFFHLSTLSRLMSIFKSSHEIKPSDSATAISADTIRLLTAILKEFTTELVHKAIISREQELSTKGGIKVYHQTREDITSQNVMYALEMMGLDGLSKDQFFSRLLKELEEDVTEMETHEVHSDDEEEYVDGPDQSPFPTETPTKSLTMQLPLHRELHPPHIRLPENFSFGNTSYGHIADNNLIPMETNDEELFEELDDEMDIDQMDLKVAHEYEAELWNSIGGR
ncbi:hypothetical protein H0H93_003540 [Arthromyces matolae]|nr:hypothetical protein H0H93_003540 [Arthromyces matolae]